MISIDDLLHPHIFYSCDMHYTLGASWRIEADANGNVNSNTTLTDNFIQCFILARRLLLNSDSTVADGI